MYKFDQKPNTKLSQRGNQAVEHIKTSEYAVLVGRNNCGKSFLLKTITQQIGQNASYLGPARYNNFNVLGYYTPKKNKKQEKWRQFLQQFQKDNQNIDNSPLNLQQAIAELNDDKREKLFEIISFLLDTDITILHTVEDNNMSQKYINANGHNISFTSSGFRLIATLLTCLLDDEYDTFLIDEPELGISPEAQGVLADFLFDREHREKYFPHVKTLVFATHSTIFLDRANISNNYTISKDGDVIDIERVSSQAEFNRIHFFLLGNRFETLYLPSAIILAEGKCDQQYLSRVLENEFPGAQFSVINATSDSRMKEILNLAGSLFSDLQKSPYRERIIPVLDSVHGADIVHKLKAQGVAEENIIIWSQNGIEYCYPDEIIDVIYGAGGDLEIDGDIVSRNGISYKKAELTEKVVSRLSDKNTYPDEFYNKFIQAIERITGLTSQCTQTQQSCAGD